ncbi:hypothetical protein L208DRAFT_123278 [Tricholoma matsutake]|nr:hypothetical protein L208DRAFT_123278 [Tricholoma matsutake 945]
MAYWATFCRVLPIWATISCDILELEQELLTGALDGIASSREWQLLAPRFCSSLCGKCVNLIIIFLTFWLIDRITTHQSGRNEPLFQKTASRVSSFWNSIEECCSFQDSNPSGFYETFFHVVRARSEIGRIRLHNVICLPHGALCFLVSEFQYYPKAYVCTHQGSISK